MKARHWIATIFFTLALAHSFAASSSSRQAREQEKAFLAANEQREGIVKTRSGLQYEVLKRGSSTEMARGKHTIVLHYHGTLVDGSVFDSSVDRGQPLAVRLWNVIPGWAEGLKLMSPGDKYRFYIPSRLAYGSEGIDAIPPYTTLIFEIELLSLHQKKRKG